MAPRVRASDVEGNQAAGTFVGLSTALQQQAYAALEAVLGVDQR